LTRTWTPHQKCQRNPRHLNNAPESGP